jgi:hypothetical protein
MRQVRSPAWFCDKILTLHPSILKVIMLEEKADHFIIIDEAVRSGVDPLACDISRFLAGGQLSPALVLGKPAESELAVPKFLGVLYSNEAIIFTRISAQRVLAICAEPSGFEEALQKVNRALPTIINDLDVGPAPAVSIKSAAEVAEIARNYVANLARTPDVFIDEATLNQTNGTWEIEGSYRPNPFARTRRFQLQLGSENGAVISFASPRRPSLAPLLTGIGIIIGTLLLVVWILLVNG